MKKNLTIVWGGGAWPPVAPLDPPLHGTPQRTRSWKTVMDIYTDMEKDNDSAEGMFAGIATHIDTAKDTVTETDMDKNYQRLGFGRVRHPWSK